MARNLLRLAMKTKDQAYRDRSIRTVKAFALAARTSPTSMPLMLRTLDELLDAKAAMEPAEPKPQTDLKQVKHSADVVTAQLMVAEPKDGRRSFVLSLSVAEPWHLYANPVGLETLLESQTDVAVYVGGKKVDAKVIYPKGKEIADSTGAKYFVYEGKVTIAGSIPATSGEFEARMKFSACKDGLCLPPSEVKVR
jgi:hypothetical protein